jgi:omega-amidase
MTLVAAFQFDITEDATSNLAAVERALEEAVRSNVELVVLPEMWPTSFPPAGGADSESLAASADAVRLLVEYSAKYDLCVAGSAYGPGDPLPTNRLHVFDRGREALVYDKVHLFTPTAERAAFAAGESPPSTVDTSVGRLSGAICYDLRFPELQRVAFRDGAELFVLPAQWPETRAHHWRALVIARAIENQCFLIAGNRLGTAYLGRRRLRLDFPGNSLIVSPYGEVLAEGKGQPGLVIADLSLDEVRRFRTRVPVRKDERVDLYGEWIT